MKLFLFIIILSFSGVTVFAQALELRAGISPQAINYFCFRFEAPSPAAINLSAKAFLQSSHSGNLHYTGYGLDVLAEISNGDRTSAVRALVVRGGLGGTMQLENEPVIYAGWPVAKRLNYGIAGEFSAEWGLSEQFGLTGFVNQKFLFKKVLGSKFFAFGVGLKFHFN